MRLLERQRNGDLILRDFTGRDAPPYAILSHTWSTDNHEEVSFEDFEAGLGKRKAAWRKIAFCADRAAVDRLEHIWIDTCCIKKSSDAELSEALNSMFSWYQRAATCYVYLSDVSVGGLHHADGVATESWEEAFRRSRWFSRGWTLQELLAPSSVEFFDEDGVRLGDKRSLEATLNEITKIPRQALTGSSLDQFTVSERMSWAEGRSTKRAEDAAYSLFGIFNIHMPLIYGEGKDNAFKRLRDEIDRSTRSAQDSILLGSLSYAADAPFNAYQRQHERLCLPDTRVDLLKDIYEWAEKSNERLTFWLNGLAGTGKSTIARTLARHYFDRKRLGASFFFSRGGGDVGYAQKFVTTVAVQLAESIPDLRRHMCDAIRERGDTGLRTLRDQWDELVLAPLAKTNRGAGTSSYLVIVDALDECAAESDIRTLIHLILKGRPSSDIRLQFFLTSRPELPIRYEFSQVKLELYQDCVLHNISSTTVDHDIYRFLHHHLGIIGKERQLGTGWPGDLIVHQLVQKASGLFIWAATACRFIREGRRFAARRLQSLLQGNHGALTAPEKHLDDIYNTVLRQTISSEYTDDEREEASSVVRQVLGSIAMLFSPLCISSLTLLIAIPEEDTKQTVDELHSILDIPRDETQPLRLHHPSFRDFLLNKDRCTDLRFQVNEQEFHHTLVNQCIAMMSKSLKGNICSAVASDTSVEDVGDRTVQNNISSEVQYACLYWVQHLQQGKLTFESYSQVVYFLQEHLLHWLEAMSWMRKVSEAIHAVNALRSIVPASWAFSRLLSLVHDAWRFVLYGRSAFEKHPLQLYCSALLFAPENSLVRSRFQHQRPTWIKRLPTVRKDWNALLQTLELDGSKASAMAFSFDSKLLAAASSDRSIRVWDAATGAERLCFYLESESACAMAFSPDNKVLALATRSGTLALRDPVTGLQGHMLLGHSDRVKVIAFSPDNRIIASGSHDKTIKLWDAVSGTERHTLQGHDNEVLALAFLPGGQLLATAAECESSVKIWNVTTGVELRTLGPFNTKGVPVTFSRDGTILATSDGAVIKLWDMDSHKQLHRIWDDTGATSIAISPANDLLASTSSDTVFIRQMATRGREQAFNGHAGPVYRVEFSPDGRLVSTADDMTIKLWDAVIEYEQSLNIENHSVWVNIMKFSPDGKLLASASHDNTVVLWDASIWTKKHVLGNHEAWINDMSFSPNGTLLATAGGTTVKIWATATRREHLRADDQVDRITKIMFSPDGNFLASITTCRTIMVWDVTTGARRLTIEGQDIRLQSPLSHSLTSWNPLMVKFINRSNCDIMAFWIDFDGVSKYYWTVGPDGIQTQGTHVGHHWRLVKADTKEIIGDYFGSKRHTIVEIIQSDIDALERSSAYLRDAIEHLDLWSRPGGLEQQPPESRFMVRDHWITDRSGRRLVWLPNEYRPICHASYLNTLVLGLASGQITFLEIDCAAVP